MNEDFGMYPGFKRGQRKLQRLSFFSFIFGNLGVNGWFILINIIFFIISLLSGILSNSTCESTLCRYAAIQPTNFLLKGYIWTLLTSMFLHGSFFHLFVNMLVLFSLGGLCEKIIGRKRFLWFYLLSGVFAGLLFVFLAYFFGVTEIGAKIFSSPFSYAVGASGAIFAIAGLFVVLTPKLRFYIIFLPFFSLPAYIMVPLVLFFTWLVSSTTGFPVGNTAHLGGFLCGVIYGLYLKNRYKRKTRLISEIFSG